MTTETTSKITEGDWRAEFQPAGELVAHWDIKVGGVVLACLPEDTLEPDARVMAASKDLLAALKAVERVANDVMGGFPGAIHLSASEVLAIKHAIAKAEGRAS